MIWTICKVFIEFARILLLFYVLVCHEACGILAPQPSIEPVPHTLEDDILTSGLPEKSLQESFNNSFLFFFFSGSLFFCSSHGCRQLLINAYTFGVLLSVKEKRLSKK